MAVFLGIIKDLLTSLFKLIIFSARRKLSVAANSALFLFIFIKIPPISGLVSESEAASKTPSNPPFKLWLFILNLNSL